MIAGMLPPGIENLGAALEMLHTYSLIHDDLPALDNDDLRRGRPTCHKAFGEATAILAGDALQTYAYEVLAKLPAPAEARTRIIAEIAHATGTIDGMIGGQVMDLEAEHTQPALPTLESIHRSKTAALITASVVTGGIYAGADDESLERMRCYGQSIGLAFQIVGAALAELRTSGPATTDQLLERVDWWPTPTRPQIENDAIRIATRRGLLLRHLAILPPARRPN